jgi:hypothetical protein
MATKWYVEQLDAGDAINAIPVFIASSEILGKDRRSGIYRLSGMTSKVSWCDYSA